MVKGIFFLNSILHIAANSQTEVKQEYVRTKIQSQKLVSALKSIGVVL